MTKEPVLHIFRSGAETEIHTDASMWGYRAILIQKVNQDNMMHPVYYYTRRAKILQLRVWNSSENPSPKEI